LAAYLRYWFPIKLYISSHTPFQYNPANSKPCFLDSTSSPASNPYIESSHFPLEGYSCLVVIRVLPSPLLPGGTALWRLFGFFLGAFLIFQVFVGKAFIVVGFGGFIAGVGGLGRGGCAGGTVLLFIWYRERRVFPS